LDATRHIESAGEPVAKSAWDLLGEAIDILMESSPRDLNVTQRARDVGAVSGASDVHDLHVWSIAGGMRVLTAHVQVADNRRLSECDNLVNQIHCLVCGRYSISHTTIQVEQAGCAHSDLYCCLPDAEHHHDHSHQSESDGLAAPDNAEGASPETKGGMKRRFLSTAQDQRTALASGRFWRQYDERTAC
jgi:hypothetical protein